MENPILKDIVAMATGTLTNAYGFCSLADGDDVAFLNCSDNDGNEIRIHITCKPEEEE